VSDNPSKIDKKADEVDGRSKADNRMDPTAMRFRLVLSGLEGVGDGEDDSVESSVGDIEGSFQENFSSSSATDGAGFVLSLDGPLLRLARFTIVLPLPEGKVWRFTPSCVVAEGLNAFTINIPDPRRMVAIVMSLLLRYCPITVFQYRMEFKKDTTRYKYEYRNDLLS